MEKFKKLKLSEGILRAIKEAKFEAPSEIQEKTIPLVLEGRDLIGSSATGSGKTLAFGAGIIEKIKKGHGIQALILTPTRELAEQVTNHLKMFSKYYELSIKEVYGGVSISPQIQALERADVVVGTPGRILDHLKRRTLNLSKVKFLVLDEADKMLEMGFIEDVQEIIEQCPRERQTLLFSATISQDIERIVKRYTKNPVYVEVESYVDSSKLHQIFYDVPQDMKFSLLVNLLNKEKDGLIMVFCNTRRNVDLVAKNLRRYNIRSLAIHGGLSQNKRNSILKEFHSHEALILVCTDVAARGLDIKNISHVYNYDVSPTSKEYIHRIGRTARAGKEGIAVSLVSPRDYDNFRNVKNDESLKIEQADLPELEFLAVNFKSDNRDRGNFRSRGFSRPHRTQGHSRDRNERPRSSSGGRFQRRDDRSGNRSNRDDRPRNRFRRR